MEMKAKATDNVTSVKLNVIKRFTVTRFGNINVLKRTKTNSM